MTGPGVSAVGDKLTARLAGLFARLVDQTVTSGMGAIARTLDALARCRFRRPVFESNQLAHKLAWAARTAGPKTLERLVLANVDAHGTELVEAGVRTALTALDADVRMRALRDLLLGAMRALAAREEQSAIRLGESYVDVVDYAKVTRILVTLETKAGNIFRPIQLLERMDGEESSALYARRKVDACLLFQGMRFGAERARAWKPASDCRILYHVSQCQPHHSGGYAIRTHWLVRNLLERGWDTRTCTRFGYPNDRFDFVGRDMVPNHAEVDGISYTLSPDRNGFRSLDPQSYHDAAVRTLMHQARKFSPALIHSASNHIVGLAGADAARRLGVPSIYEMRGLWHMTVASKRPGYEDSEHYRMTQLLEIQAANGADHVFTITEAMRDLVVAEGICADKVTVVPNAVDVQRFAPLPRNRELAAKLGFADEVVIGYVGSFAAYEGLDTLLRATCKLRESCDVPFRVLLVGDGPTYDDLVALAGVLDILDIVTFAGRVSYDRVGDYYSLIDIATYPRSGDRVCELVSPLKPYEAMAMEKAVVVSDVAALAAMVRHEKTGLVHRRDDVGSLTKALETLLVHDHLRARLGEEGRAWVSAHRTWARITSIVGDVYHHLLGSENEGGQGLGSGDEPAHQTVGRGGRAKTPNSGGGRFDRRGDRVSTFPRRTRVPFEIGE